MRAARNSAAVAIVGLAWLACGPIGPLSGGRLSGEMGATSVRDWSFAGAEKTAQLETRPADPHSVNTWFASVGARLYVPTSMIRGPSTPSERSWVQHVSEDPRVRIRLAGTLFSRVAVKVDDESEYDAARHALETKYELDAADLDPERAIWIYRLEAPN